MRGPRSLSGDEGAKLARFPLLASMDARIDRREQSVRLSAMIGWHSIENAAADDCDAGGFERRDGIVDQGGGKGLLKSRVAFDSTAALAVALLLCFGANAALATSTTWTGATDSIWATSSNWSGSPAVVPGTGDSATFRSTNNGHTTISLGAGVTISLLGFDLSAPLYTIGAGAVSNETLTFNNGGIVQLVETSLGDQLINAAVVLGTTAGASSYTFSSYGAGKTLTFAGPISGGPTGAKTLQFGQTVVPSPGNIVVSGAIGGGGGTIAVTKTGTGTLTLSGNNSFTGALTIAAGTVVVPTVNNASTAGPLGNSATAVSIASTANATLEYTGGTSSSSKDFSLGGFTSTFQIDSAAAELTLSAAMDGAGGLLKKTGPGTLTLTGANTYTEETWVNTGTLKVSGSGKLGSTAAFLQVDAGATLDLNGTSQSVNGINGYGTIVNNGGGAVTLTSTPTTANNYFYGVIADNNNATTGTVGLTKAGTGYLVLTGANTYSGPTLVTANDLAIAGNGTLGNTVGGTTVSSGATLRLAVTSCAENITISGVGYQAGEGALEGYDTTYTGLLALGAAATVCTFAPSDTTFAITNPGTILGASRTLTLSGFSGSKGSISSIIGTGTGGVIVSDGAIWTLTGANTFSGIVTVNSNSTLVIPTINNGGAGNFGPLGISSATTAVSLTTGTLEYTGGTASSNKPFTLSTSGTIQVDNAATELTLSGIIAGAGDALTKTGPGTLTLTAANTYSGGTTLSGGTLKLSGGNDRLATTGGLVMNGGKLDLGGTDQTVASLIGYGTIVNNGGGSSVLTVNTSTTNNAYSNFIFDNDNATAGTVGISKSGTGTLNLSLGGTSNYTGAVLVTNGILVANSFDALGSATGSTIVSSGATLRIQSTYIAAEPIEISGVGETGTAGALEGTASTYGGLLKLNAASTIAAIDIYPEFSFAITNTGTIFGATTGLALTLAGGGDGSLASIWNGGISGTPGAGTLVKTGTGKWALFGANTYTGTTTISAGILNIQNASALGGTANDTTITAGATLQIEGGITTPAAEAVTIRGVGAVGATGAFENVAGVNDWAGPVILGADSTISSDAGTFIISNTGTIYGTTTGFDLTLAGAGNGSLASIWNGGISSAVGAGTLIKAGTGTWTLTNLNTYTGKTFIRDGVLDIKTLKNVSGGSSSLGAPTTAANGTIDMGSTTTTGTLRFTGTADAASNRVINLAGTTGGATFDSSSATNNKIQFTSAFTATGLGDKTLTLTGTSTGANEVSAAIVNSTGFKTSVAKSGSGTWTLSGVNTYTGNTAVNMGTLTITSAFLANAADVNLTTGANLNLTFAGSDTITQLRIDGVVQSPGTWGSLSSSATYKTALITGTGTLTVGSGPATQPYASWAATYPLSGANYPFTADPDRDGLANGLEWILGGTPLAPNAIIQPQVGGTAANLTLTFARNDGSESSSTLLAQWATDLTGASWNDVPIGATSSGPNVNGVIVTVTENGAAADAIVVTIPRSNGPQGRLFVRLRATMP